MSFSFNTTAGASQNSAKSKLEGNDIYTVKFDGCEIIDIKGVKDPTITYKVLKLKFSNADGYHDHTVFEPRPEDHNRTETKYTKDGKEGTIPQASGVESMMLLFKHSIDAIAPAIAKQIDDGSKNLGAPDWESLRTLVCKILETGKGKETTIKLVKNNKGEAIFPGFFTGITKEGKAYIRNNFIGDKLAFTAYETTRINNSTNATPTRVNTLPFTNTTPTLASSGTSSIDLDFEMPFL